MTTQEATTKYFLDIWEVKSQTWRELPCVFQTVEEAVSLMLEMPEASQVRVRRYRQ